MAAALLGHSSLAAVAVGVGAGLTVSLSLGVTSFGLMSLLFASFLVTSNFVPSDVDHPLLMVSMAGCLGLFLGSSVGGVFDAPFSGTSSGAALFGTTEDVLPIPLFIILVMLFHIAELAFVICFHPNDVRIRSMMLNPVPYGGYSVALISALLEYWLEFWLLPVKSPGGLPDTLCKSVTIVGFAFGMLGWSLRTAALFTAKSNFTHLVSHERVSGHSLVTSGVYRLCRHPGYMGWFLWSVSTQVVLRNPICFLLYAYVSWRFFADRIPTEETRLVEFFGDEYLAYARKVSCGIPCISVLDT